MRYCRPHVMAAVQVLELHQMPRRGIRHGLGWNLFPAVLTRTSSEAVRVRPAENKRRQETKDGFALAAVSTRRFFRRPPPWSRGLFRSVLPNPDRVEADGRPGLIKAAHYVTTSFCPIPSRGPASCTRRAAHELTLGPSGPAWCLLHGPDLCYNSGRAVRGALED